MNELLYSLKITPEHLARKAIVYLRQSSEKQVRQNTESQRLQYDMAERIRGLGWQDVEVINSDLGSNRAMILAFTTGMIGSSSPATISVCWRISGKANRLVHTAPASS